MRSRRFYVWPILLALAASLYGCRSDAVKVDWVGGIIDSAFSLIDPNTPEEDWEDFRREANTPR